MASFPPSEVMFHGTRVRVHLRTADTGGVYGLLEMWHPPSVGPALHVHPRGPESFLVLEGDYTFIVGSESAAAGPGSAVTVPAGVPHRYEVGAAGGHVLVVCPPGLEQYFEQVASQGAERPLSWQEEMAVAAEHGQEFLDRAGHWIRLEAT
jgi:mannose-6-phosphate isomerase-like protein (cupin superfamily)